MATKLLKQHEILFIKAKEDFVAAKYLLDGFNHHGLELNLEIIFFHFQQCAEKLIKTVLDIHNIKFPHTHDLDNLMTLLEENEIFLFDDLEELLPLTDFAVEGRYSIIHDDLNDSDKYITLLNTLMEIVAAKM
ncbi:MAG: HEPN domain-containing protein [Sulfuricurvum sp.]|jgi:HEPN domain-containing protein|uniref:HEPN domain-containing protein n=1 Tax=Sulfuricurvum sp. TaxID=2025608 RepID=UPI0025E1D967|nr:HEPN domain-containing protein [Sulfuricurvum sp.]MCK9373345.1 HEPN domain-containing protein [Sulfuricurvum sp.]